MVDLLGGGNSYYKSIKHSAVNSPVTPASSVAFILT